MNCYCTPFGCLPVTPLGQPLCSGKCVKRWHEKIIRVANMIEDLLLPGTVLSGPKAQILCEGGSVPLRKRQARVLVIIMYCSGCCRWREGG